MQRFIPTIVACGMSLCSTSNAFSETRSAPLPSQQEEGVRQIAVITFSATAGQVDGPSILDADLRLPGVSRHQNEFSLNSDTLGVSGALGYRLQFSNAALGFALGVTWERSDTLEIFQGDPSSLRNAKERLSSLDTSLGLQLVWKIVAIGVGAGLHTLSVLSTDPNARFESNTRPSLSMALQFYVVRCDWFRLPAGAQLTRRFETLNSMGDGIHSDWIRIYVGVEFDVPMD